MLKEFDLKKPFKTVEPEKPNAFEQLGLKTSEARKSIGTILTEAGFKARTIERHPSGLNRSYPDFYK